MCLGGLDGSGGSETFDHRWMNYLSRSAPRYQIQSALLSGRPHGISGLLAAVEFVDEPAASQLIDEAQINKILCLGLTHFGIPRRLHLESVPQSFQGGIGILDKKLAVC